jgi:hypothetical protein
MTGDSFGNWAAGLGAAATLGILVAAVWAAVYGVRNQIEQQRTIERRRRVYDHQATLNSRDFAEMTAEAVHFIELFRSNPATAAPSWQRAFAAVKMRVIAVLNFYELVAGEYNETLLDRDIANPTLAYVAVGMWDYADPFLAHLRQEGGGVGFEQWKAMVATHGERIRTTALAPPAQPSPPRRHRAIPRSAAVAVVLALVAAGVLALLSGTRHDSLIVVAIALLSVPAVLVLIAFTARTEIFFPRLSVELRSEIRRALMLTATLALTLSAAFTLAVRLADGAGPRGPRGFSGTNGHNGHKGHRGRRGPRGHTGPRGPEGPPGRAGSGNPTVSIPVGGS